MESKRFVNILISVIVWMLILFALQCLFAGYTKEFGLSCGMCFLSIFFLFFAAHTDISIYAQIKILLFVIFS